MDLTKWFEERDRIEEKKEADRAVLLKDKKAVEKSNKDELFRYHIAKVDESDYAVEDEPEITNRDFVLGVRPECIKLDKNGAIPAVIYGAMPTGMESTLKLRIGKFLLTGVVFGSVLFRLGEETGITIEGSDILLFDRKSGKLITSGRIRVR